VNGGLGGEGTPGENTSLSGLQDPSGVLTALAVAISELRIEKGRKKADLIGGK